LAGNFAWADVPARDKITFAMKEASDQKNRSTNAKRKQRTESAPAPGEQDLTLPEPGRCNFTALRKAVRRISQLYDSVFAACGLRATQWSILIHVGRAGRPTQAELADSLALDRSALAHNLKPLERDGLVQIVPDEKDKRARLVVLTPTGRAKVAESLHLWDEAQSVVEVLFGAQKAKSLRDSLEVLSSKAFSHSFQELRRKDSGRDDRKSS
jgi:DNA-binding MarR family transcriptional regulator